MSEKITNYVCPACMGSVHFAAEAGNIECDYCGSVYSVEEMEALMADQNAAAEEAAKKVDEWEVIQQEWIGEGMKAYTCPACKAELICDETTAATSCPYCGNPTVVPGQFTGAAKPDYVIPFKLAKEAAVEKLQSHCKGKVLLPRSFTENNHLEEVKGIYVPFWLYDGVAKGAATYEATKKHTKTVGDERITTTEYYSVTRAGEAVFEKIPADGSSKMPDDLMDSIEPYHYNEMKEFSKAYLTGYLADRYDVTAEESAPRIRERAKATLQSMLRETVTGYDSVEVVQSNTVITEGKVSYAMMPVWLLSTKWNDQNFLFAMNGQTGKMVGDLPADKAKLWKIILGVLLIAEIIMGLVTAFGSAPLTFGAIAVKFVVIPLIAAVIVGFSLMGQLKSVHKGSEARNYMDKSKFNLTRNREYFVRRDVKREKIQKQQ